MYVALVYSHSKLDNKEPIRMNMEFHFPAPDLSFDKLLLTHQRVPLWEGTSQAFPALNTNSACLQLAASSLHWRQSIGVQQRTKVRNIPTLGNTIAISVGKWLFSYCKQDSMMDDYT